MSTGLSQCSYGVGDTTIDLVPEWLLNVRASFVGVIGTGSSSSFYHFISFGGHSHLAGVVILVWEA